MGMKVHRACRHTLKLNKSLYVLKQASANWFEHRNKGLESKFSGWHFTQLKVDPYVFYRHDCIVLCYVDESVLVSRDKKQLSSL